MASKGPKKVSNQAILLYYINIRIGPGGSESLGKLIFPTVVEDRVLACPKRFEVVSGRNLKYMLVCMSICVYIYAFECVCLLVRGYGTMDIKFHLLVDVG